MKKIMFSAALVLGMFMFTLVPANKVNADSSDCTFVTDSYGRSIRVCDTGIEFSNLSSSVSPEIGFALIGMFGVGGIVTINGKILKAKLDR